MTSVGVSGPAGAWEIASARIQPFISKPNKHKSSGCSLCLFAAFMMFTNLMDRRICIYRFWLAGGKAIILIGFLFYTCIVGFNPQPWMPINTQTKVYSFHQITMSCTNTTKYTAQVMEEKSVQNWYISFVLQLCYDIRASKIVLVQQLDNEVLACKFYIQDPSPCSPPEC